MQIVKTPSIPPWRVVLRHPWRGRFTLLPVLSLQEESRRLMLDQNLFNAVINTISVCACFFACSSLALATCCFKVAKAAS